MAATFIYPIAPSETSNEAKKNPLKLRRDSAINGGSVSDELPNRNKAMASVRTDDERRTSYDRFDPEFRGIRSQRLQPSNRTREMIYENSHVGIAGGIICPAN
ncbi:hypothetical protein SDJN03_20454, partial [Cucurbita argyrosperma subsp. sororia]